MMDNLRVGRCSLLSALLSATILAGPPASAQTPAAQGDPNAPAVATPANPSQSAESEPALSSGAAPESKGEIVVTGFRQSYANAINNKKQTVAISDGISSDGLGRFPDLNVGEALQRVPGVQINREAEGRNATINLRGLPGEYARLTVNGVAFAEPILSDATPLGAFNSDIFSGIVVNKSPLADAQSGGLSGNVDLQIAPALGRKEGGSAKVSYEYNELGKSKTPAATISYNHHFSSDFAIFGVFAYKREDFRRDSVLFNSYTSLTQAQAQANAALVGANYGPSAACPSCTGTTSTGGVLYNSQTRQYSRLNEGNLFSGAAGAEYQLDDHTKVGLTGFFTDRKQPKTRQLILISTLNAASGVTALTAPVKLGDGRYVVNDFNYSNPDLIMSTRGFGQHQKTWGLNGNGEWKTDEWRIGVIGTASKASNTSKEVQLDLNAIQIAGGNGRSGTVHTGAGNLDDFSFTLSPDPATSIAGLNIGAWGGIGDPTSFYDSTVPSARRNRLAFAGTQNYATNELYAAQFDIERQIGGVISSVQVGGRFEESLFTSRGFRSMAYGLQVQNLTPAFLGQSPTANNFFDGNGGSTTTNWQVANLNLLPSLGPVAVFPGGQLSPAGYNINYADNGYQLNNFTNRNDLIIGYGQVKYEFELGGINIRGNGGLRLEHTNNTIDALNRVSLTNSIGQPSDFRNETYKQSYTKLLPSFIAVAEITDRLMVRGAAYKTYVRPQPRQFSPNTVVSAPNNGTYTLTLGNPRLRPYDATSFDVSVEWYNRPNSLFSVAAFQKRIKGLIASITDPRQLCPSDGTALGLGTLRINGDRCESSLTYTSGGVTLPFLVSGSGLVNQSSPITVRGIEMNAQQSFDFLPGALRYLGGGANYAYTTISGRTGSGAQATLPGVSKHNVNIIGYYETPAFGIRAVYNLRSKYDLASAGTFTGAARQVRARGQLDMSGTYNINSSLSLSVDAYNLTNAVRYEYENQDNLPRRFDYDGRTYTMSLRATF